MHRKTLIPGLILLTILTITASGLAGPYDYIPKVKFLEEQQKTKPPVIHPTDDAPPQPARAVAEWEPATGVLITYPLQIPIELVAAMAEVVEVMTEVINESAMRQAGIEYANAGVDTSNCTFFITGGNIGCYTRDHGPWYIFNGDDEQGIVIPQYYYPFISMLGDTLGVPVYGAGFSCDGGNYMTDGMGNALTTNYVYSGNPWMTEEQINQIFVDYLGITNLQTTPHPWGTIVPHIDTHAKFLDPGRLLVIQPDPPNSTIESNVAFWSTLLSGYGRPYEIIRVPGTGYSNSLFLNDHIFVALNGDPVADSTALAIFSDALPGYTVQGFDYPSFSFLDALHCRTHEMHDRYMLRIVHVPIHDSENTGGGYYLEAEIHPYSNEPLVGPPVIMWKTEGGSYSPVALTFAGNDTYYGEIPAQPDGSNVYYYLEAEDGSGRVEAHPPVGPGNPHHFFVGPDNTAPVVQLDPPPGTLEAPEWPTLLLTATARDDRWISAVLIEHSINGIPQAESVLSRVAPFAFSYEGSPTSSVQPGDIVELRVRAVDTSINLNTACSPYYTIDILAGPDVIVTLTPYGTPIQIPGNGGSFQFNVEIVNNEPNLQSFDVWTMVQLPDQSWIGPLLGPKILTLQSGAVAEREPVQFVPEQAPPGIYQYCAYVGDYPAIIWNQDSFEFEKLETADGGLAMGDWSIKDSDFLEPPLDGFNQAPASFVLHSAYPNPFNPTTTISFDLPEARRVELLVYDVAGREVAELVSGWRDAGVHAVTFDAAGLSTGIYVYRLAAGNFTGMGKMVLIK